MDKNNVTKLNNSVVTFLVIMSILSFSNIFKLEVKGEPLKLAGLTIIVGLVAFFVTKKTNESKQEALDIKTFLPKLKSKKVILLISIPVVLNIILVFVYKAFMPEYFEFLQSRLPFELEPSRLTPIIFELMVIPLGEEIAMRAFFQKQTTKVFGFIPSIIITSVLFAVGHFSYGAAAIMILDIGGIFIDSIFYGLVFKETDNAWCSWVPHFLTDIIVILMIMVLAF